MPLEFQDTPQYRMYSLMVSVFYYLADFISRLGRMYFKQTSQKSIADQTPLPKNEVHEFCDGRKTTFMRLFAEGVNDETTNANINDVFYDKIKYKEKMEEYDNEVEREWKRRILMDSTPRGNVIMYYDPYKLGFAYYSDNHIPYVVLNGVAMKYVATYKCRNFFMDDFIVPEGKMCLSIKTLREEDKKQKNITENSIKIEKEVLDSAPFAKLKSYNKSGGIQSAQSSADNRNVNKNANATKIAEKKQMMNTFIHLGKTSNFSIIQKTPKQNTLNGFHTSLLSSKKISWTQFKEIKKE